MMPIDVLLHCELGSALMSVVCEHEVNAFHTKMVAAAAARGRSAKGQQKRQLQTTGPVVAWRRRADGPDLGHKKIKEIAFLALKTQKIFWPAGAGGF